MNILPFADAAGAAGTALIFGFPLFIFLIFAFLSIFWIWALIDAIINPRLKDMEKLIWVVVVLFSHIIGAVLYFLIGRSGSTGGGAPTV